MHQKLLNKNIAALALVCTVTSYAFEIIHHKSTSYFELPHFGVHPEREINRKSVPKGYMPAHYVPYSSVGFNLAGPYAKYVKPEIIVGGDDIVRFGVKMIGRLNSIKTNFFLKANSGFYGAHWGLGANWAFNSNVSCQVFLEHPLKQNPLESATVNAGLVYHI